MGFEGPNNAICARYDTQTSVSLGPGICVGHRDTRPKPNCPKIV